MLASQTVARRLGVPHLRRVVGVVLCIVSLVACHGAPSGTDQSAPSGSAMTKLVLRDETRDLMLTWVDPTGDFHVVDTIDQVPAEARERVRVVKTNEASGTGDAVYVADLRQKAADGSYTVTIVPRSTWEETGAARRKARIEALAPVASQLQPAPSASAPSQDQLVAVIYGAKWCGACREAERYLKKIGVKVLEKDVDQSPAVQAELRAKLVKAQLPPTSSIPIIDIGGKILVGFSQAAVDAALRSVRK